MSRFSELMRALSDDLGLELPAEIVSPAEFTLDDVPVILSSEIRSGLEEIVLHALLGTVPEAREVEVYRVLLEANVMWSGTGDATLGVNSATRGVVLCYRNPADRLTGASLGALIEAFVAVAANWRNFIEAAHEAATLIEAPVLNTVGMIRG